MVVEFATAFAFILFAGFVGLGLLVMKK